MYLAPTKDPRYLVNKGKVSDCVLCRTGPLQRAESIDRQRLRARIIFGMWPVKWPLFGAVRAASLLPGRTLEFGSREGYERPPELASQAKPLRYRSINALVSGTAKYSRISPSPPAARVLFSSRHLASTWPTCSFPAILHYRSPVDMKPASYWSVAHSCVRASKYRLSWDREGLYLMYVLCTYRAPRDRCKLALITSPRC